ncbi:MAG: D-glycero-beta-D-manno-heptose-7-phosphate kinase [Blastocatellia bacterium]|jgi:D-beta-D-heptose 7-phosphate kinase/D-beta-D-heptose 1-phosphate adenosyltransferase|nr:D-glycero-beta-D-manno-heptose-7-phosphate kinase [Blastocatellia bacterium]
MTTIDKQRATELLGKLGDRNIVVLGDVMLDEFLWGDVTRISPEAPVPVVDIRRESTHLGGAANVLANLVALGAKACVVGLVGDDFAGERIRSSVGDKSDFQADNSLIKDGSRPTTIKTRIIAQNQMVVRADREHRTPVSGKTEDLIIAAIKSALENAHALIVSDYDKGVVTPRILAEVLPIAYGRMPVLIDPKLRNFEAYRPATLITPNHHEALRMANLEEDSDEGLKQAARSIRSHLSCDAVLITRGDRGMMLVEADREPINVDTVAREVFDVTGAGDTVIAALAAALAAGSSMTEAAVLANHAAGIVVGKLGTATATGKEVLDSIQ